MRTDYNADVPLVMHVDLNSCFASIEQQARPLLRGKPVAIVNRRTEHTAIVTASYEAKARGVKVGMRVRDARLLCPDLVALESDPAKYRYVYHKLLDIMNDYSAQVTMKSIDEGVIDFHQAPASIVARGLESIGLEIKQRLRDEVGVWMRANVGIATNRFLAKTAAGLHKPDGLDVITSKNLREVLGSLTLTDLTGIAAQNEKRLKSVGIMTPLQFLDADAEALRDVVFKSVVGEWWHQRLRGWEVDDKPVTMRRVGRQYVLDRFDLTEEEVLRRLHHLCESVGGRLRGQRLAARGVYVYAKTTSAGYWHASQLQQLPFASDQAIYSLARQLFLRVPDGAKEIGIHCYQLEPADDPQLSLFSEEILLQRRRDEVIDEVNGRYGERTLHAASTLDAGIYETPKIPFGSTRYL